MKILVCIKQVPDMESRFKPDEAGLWYSEADLTYRMNEYDEYAVEEAVRLREKLGGDADLTVLSMGPDRVVKEIKKALAMGCDRAVHIQDPEVHRRDPWQVASVIAAFARDKGFDIVFTGMQSQDRGSAQVGATIAGILGWACTTTIVGFEYADGVIIARRELEGGLKGIVKLQPPAVLTCQLGLNLPRYPTLPNLMRAKKKEILAVPVESLPSGDAKALTSRFYPPPARKGDCMLLEGDVNEMADRLLGILRDKTTVVR